MTQVSCNCIVCAQEFDSEELQSIALSKINVTRFKICETCLNNSDPAEDYKQARELIHSYIKFSEAKHLFGEVKDILDSINN